MTSRVAAPPCSKCKATAWFVNAAATVHITEISWFFDDGWPDYERGKVSIINAHDFTIECLMCGNRYVPPSEQEKPLCDICEEEQDHPNHYTGIDLTAHQFYRK